jgi:hypothetical protein
MEAIFLILAVAGPVTGYLWADRLSGGSIPHALAGAALGGFTAGLLFALTSIAGAAARPALGSLLPWVLAFTGAGAALGILGILARLLGSRLRS